LKRATDKKVRHLSNFRLSIIAACMLVIGNTGYAGPCARLKAERNAWVAAKVDALVSAARAAYEKDEALPAYERVLDGIADSIHQCKLSEDPDFIGRYQAFLDYVEAASLDRDPDHELGFIVSDKQYFAETRKYVKIPEFLMNQSFLRAVSHYETLERAKSFLRQLNSIRQSSDQLIFFSYKSRHLGTPDNDASYRRLLIVVPGNAKDQVPEKWIQFGVPDPGARLRVRNVSVVAVTAGSDGTFDAYFKDFYRIYQRNGSIDINGRWELGEGDDNCVQCHKSGILPIFPVMGSVSVSEEQFVSNVNQRFLTYGSPRFGKYLDERKFGPGLSSASTGDRKQRFGANFSGTVSDQAMSCAACHQQERLGALNWPMDRVVISSFVKGGRMPLGYKLKVTERRDLYAKLVQEYFATDKDNPGILKSWLLSAR
jgi:hypothetical protein